MKILYGYAARDRLLIKISKKIQYLKSHCIIPSLAVILNNNSHASLVYIANKQKICEKLHIKFKLFKLDQSSTAQEMLKLIHKLNNDKKINGIFVQLPISKKIPERIVIDAINPIKDVDCFHNYNVGKIWTTKNEAIILSPCTPAGIIALFDYYQISLEGKNVVIVNRSNIIGKPLAALFLQKNATVTVCHSKTKGLKNICKKADIVITAIGQANYFDKSYFRNNAIIVDVGINWDKNNKPCGDVNMSSLKKFHGYISPIPGGVGPLTVAMLINNLVNLTMIQNKIKEID